MKNVPFFGKNYLISSVTTLVAGSLAAPYLNAEESSSNGVSAFLEEITVTARKREEGLQDAPIAISAFSGESLELRGFESLDDIDAVTPNLSFRSFGGPGGSTNTANVYIRGVGQSDFSPNSDPGVGIYVDGIYLGRSVGSVLDLVELERVEVLRGPQGTLFGRNSIGGAISIHTKKPQ